MKHVLPAIALLLATPAFGEGSREMDAHEHGVGALNIAFDGDAVAMEFNAPGADIVGFEHEATSAEDRAAIDAAVGMLAKPMDLFVFPTAAECSVTHASAALENEEEHDAHAEDNDHDHDKDDEHSHDEHADDDGHDDHADAARHTEFHAEYLLTCGNPDALSGIEFAYFDTFKNALELEVQILTPAGARAFEVERDAPSLDLRGMF